MTSYSRSTSPELEVNMSMATMIYHHKETMGRAVTCNALKKWRANYKQRIAILQVATLPHNDLQPEVPLISLASPAIADTQQVHSTGDRQCVQLRHLRLGSPTTISEGIRLKFWQTIFRWGATIPHCQEKETFKGINDPFRRRGSGIRFKHIN